MNTKRFILASVVIFVVMLIIEYLVHGVILASDYKALSSLWRPESDMMSMMWIWWLTGLLFSFLFVYIFAKGYENKGIWEGIRYGIVISFFMMVPSVFGQYTMYPLPISLVLKWFIYGLIASVIYGIIAALIYKPEKAA